MTHTEIRILLMQHKVKLKDLALSEGVDRTYFSHVIAGRSKNKKIRTKIAIAVGKTVKELWPDAV